MKRLLLASILLSAGYPSATETASATAAACAPDSNVVIYYGNGMFISPARARVQTLLMDRKIRPALPTGTNVTFSYSYNNSEDDVTQALQVVAQALDDKAIKFQSWINVPSGAPTIFRNAIKELQQAARAADYVTELDLQDHVTRYTADLAAGRRVIVLAHSQGNFYANRAYERLASTAGFGIVAIGTPTSYTAGSGPYTTLTNDKIITPIPDRRAPNVTNSSAFTSAAKDSDGHSFTRSYLNGDVSGPQIVAQVNARLAALPCPASAP